MSFISGSHRFPALVIGLLLVALAGVPAAAGAVATPSPAAPDAAPGAARTTLTTTQFEARLVTLSNTRRKKIGCPAFKVSPALTKAARTHTLRMVQTGSFSHQVPKEAGLAPRIVRAGYKNWKALAENIAWGRNATPASVFSMWMHSAGHRANLQNCRLHDVGYGVRYSGKNVWVTGDYGRR